MFSVLYIHINCVYLQAQPSPTLHLKLRRPKNDKKVKWTTETVDNEHMNKKKSKCKSNVVFFEINMVKQDTITVNYNNLS